MTEISLIVTLNNQFTLPYIYALSVSKTQTDEYRMVQSIYLLLYHHCSTIYASIYVTRHRSLNLIIDKENFWRYLTSLSDDK